MGACGSTWSKSIAFYSRQRQPTRQIRTTTVRGAARCACRGGSITLVHHVCVDQRAGTEPNGVAAAYCTCEAGCTTIGAQPASSEHKWACQGRKIWGAAWAQWRKRLWVAAIRTWCTCIGHRCWEHLPPLTLKARASGGPGDTNKKHCNWMGNKQAETARVHSTTPSRLPVAGNQRLGRDIRTCV